MKNINKFSGKMYRKKQVIISAEQWWPGKNVDGVIYPCPKDKKPCSLIGEYAWINTLEKGHYVTPGDFIITGLEGERYPCNPSIFEKSYEII